MNTALFERWSSKVEFPPMLVGCWSWKGSKSFGYGKMKVQTITRPAHHIAYELLCGVIPAGMESDHLCHTSDPSCNRGNTCPHRACVNPFHIEWVTTQENIARRRDSMAKRKRDARNTCVNNHPWTEETTYLKDGWRACRTCAHISRAKMRTKK